MLLKKVGLKKKTIEIEGYLASYYDGDQRDPVVLLHGMAVEKITFVVSAGKLISRHRVILPDLQGHGENEKDKSRDYSIRSHVEFLQKFIDAIALDSFSLGGNSMGGHVSAEDASHSPQIDKPVEQRPV